ncbi:AI-2E family transporter [Candidatus Enterovibrio escicola]|uniref:Putative permease PerM n=1 Tax=Candidatus Enterovibrio escicola TaxID=1927127 RepID=A0A2A5T167_9GAMM|nr:AI-2E family transporter [Candidatus Enterovibrio escacola]PCS21891.1 putative permease PerM [Candidatus Enterovibrio escacola]
MLQILNRWYKRRCFDPHAVSLVALLVVGFIVIYFFGHLIAPLLVAIVLAYLLEWPVSKLVSIGMPRLMSVIMVLTLFVGLMLMACFGLIPTIWTQIVNLVADMPTMFSNFQNFVSHLPETHPDLIHPYMVNSFIDTVQNRVLGLGATAVKGSLSSLISLAALAVYLIIVPLLVFFLLKDKQEMLRIFGVVLPRNRRLTNKVASEMNQQISNYIRGKVTEIIIVGVTSYITFSLLDLRYTALLSVATGLSVLIPYIGAAAVTFPIFMVALFQWGISPALGYLMLSYGIIQTLDGNVLVPVLFSEAVNLHPVAIIVSVLVFGGLWGFWGVFFAIPLATLVKAVWNALTISDADEDPTEKL